MIPTHQIIKAIEDARGIIAVAASMLGVKRETLSKRIHRNEKLKAALESARETQIDLLENRFLNLCRSKNEFVSLSATKYYLSTIGKKRGYFTKIEKDEETNTPVIINYNYNGPQTQPNNPKKTP